MPKLEKLPRAPSSDRRSPAPPVWPGLRNDDSWERIEQSRRYWQWLAILISILGHVIIFQTFSGDFLRLNDLRSRSERVSEEPFEMWLEETLEEEKDYVQTNPKVPENEPDKARLVSNRDQQAAQENPDRLSDDPLPTVQGEIPSQNIIESTLREPVPPTPQVSQIPDTGQPATKVEQKQPKNPARLQGGGAPLVSENAPEPTIDQPPETEVHTLTSPAQPALQPSQSLDTVSSLAPPPDFLQGEPDPDADGEGLGLTPVEPGSESRPFEAKLKARIIPTVRPSQPNFRVVAKTPQVSQSLLSDVNRQSDQRGDSENDPLKAEAVETPSQTHSSGTPGQEPRRPRPRPQIRPVSTPGPLMDSKTSVAGREGSISVDAEFSAFGDYASRFMEVVARSWHRTLESMQMRVGDSGTRVTIEFELLSDGSVRRMKTTFYSSSELMMNICRDAIKSRDPYEPWPQDMIDLFGENKTITITFHYR